MFGIRLCSSCGARVFSTPGRKIKQYCNGECVSRAWRIRRAIKSGILRAHCKDCGMFLWNWQLCRVGHQVYLCSLCATHAAHSVRSRRRRLELKFGRKLPRHGICICCNDAGPLVVDHDHATGNFRGMICSSCNLGLGHFNDDPARLAAAICYLKEGMK